jgi:tetratricopeptide (TPR) repeat protein
MLGGGSIRLFSFRGVPVSISFFGLILITLFWVLPTATNPQFQEQGINGGIVGLGIGVGLIISIIIHELSHAILGMLFGARVISIQLDILGGATYFASKPTSYLQDALLSLAGPASNFVLWEVFKLIFKNMESSLTRDSALELPLILLYLSSINLFLGIFNALPGYPMDGGQAVHQFVMGITRNPKFAATLTLITSLGVVAYLAYSTLILHQDFSGVGMYFILYILIWISVSSINLYNNATRPSQPRPTPRQVVEQQEKASAQRAQTHPGHTAYEQGRSQLLSRDFEGAVASFSQAIEMEPREMSYLDYRAYTYAQMGNYGQAITDYNELLEKNPQRADFWSARAQAYKNLGNYDAAQYDVEQALKINPLENQALELQRELSRRVPS